MKRIVFIILGIAMLSYVTGCGKKQSMEQAQEPASMEDLSKMNAQQPAAEQKAPVAPFAVEQPSMSQAALSCLLMARHWGRLKAQTRDQDGFP